MGCSVVWTATVAAFMATKPSGGRTCTRQSGGPERSGGWRGRRFCLAMQRRGRRGKSSAAAIADPARRLWGRSPSQKAEARSSDPEGQRAMIAGMIALPHLPPATHAASGTGDVLRCELHLIDADAARGIEAEAPEILVEVPSPA